MTVRFDALLRQAGLLTAEQLRHAQAEAQQRGVSLWDLVVREKRVSEEALADAFARHVSVPRVRIASATVEPEAVKAVAHKLARKHLCLPLKIEGKVLVLAMANPLAYDALQDIEFASGLRARRVVATSTEITDGIEAHYAPDDRLHGFLANVSETTGFRMRRADLEEVPATGSETAAGAELTPVVKMCNVIVEQALKSQASDIHIEPGLNDVQVRLRIDGVLTDLAQVPKWLHSPVVSRLKILARLDIAERRLPQDGRIKVQYRGEWRDIRVSTLPTHFGEKIVMRLLGSAAVPGFTSLGFSDAQASILESALSQPQGMILVTGPTGSGKTTTLYSMICRRRSPEVNIITVEDPIEYQLEGINQMQANLKTGLTFANALRAILRQDPDVVLVGEIRDAETAEIAFQASMTGHLVLSTLHTNSAVATIARLLDLGVDPFLIASSLTLVIAQRLARRLCSGCREVHPAPDAPLAKLHLDPREAIVYRGRGCQTCRQTGYAGRLGLYEILRITPVLKELIQRRAGEGEMRKAALQAGMRPLVDDALAKVLQGLTSPEEVVRVVQIEEEADVARCPKCGTAIDSNFATCPYCLYPLERVCESCGQQLKLDWLACPYCRASTRRAVPATAAVAGVTPMTPARAGAPCAVPAGRAAVKKPRVLVVDDDEDMRKIIRLALTKLPVPVDVEAAADGLEALDAVQRARPDLVIADLMMPGMDGFALCQKLREDIATTFVPIMMLTANADETARTRGYLVGTDDYVTKPFSIPDLNARVMRLLRRTYGL